MGLLIVYRLYNRSIQHSAGSMKLVVLKQLKNYIISHLQ